MAINIIDGFYLGSATPIDSRIVATNSTSRNSIQYVYDGLKVFQTDTRQTWIWNSGLSSWELEGSSSIGGSGSHGYLSSWTSSSILSNSNIYVTGSYVGINNSNPLSTLQISGSNQPLSIDNGLGGVVIGYNWHWNSGDQVFNPSYGSSKILMDNSGGISINTKNIGGSFKSSLFLNTSTGYNILTSPGTGNFISGSVSFSSLSSPYSSLYGDLVFVDGGFRTNSSVSKNVKYLYYNGPFGPGVGSNYNVSSTDHELIISSNNSALFNVTLPNATTLNNGREITISLESISQPTSSFAILCSSNIVGLSGVNVNPVILVGETIRIVSFGTFWKVIQYDQVTSPETWKYIGTGGNMVNGQSVPGFTSSVTNSSGMHLRLRKVNNNYVHLQGNVSAVLTSSIPFTIALTLPIGYRPVNILSYPTISQDGTGKGYKSIVDVLSNGQILLVANTNELTSGSYTLNFFIDCMIPVD